MSKILIADDEVRIRELIAQYLKFEGFEYAEAANGEQVLEMTAKETFDLILLDAMMPYLDGLSTLRMLREKSEIPVIMITARGEEYDRVLGLELGADDYVVKPFSPKELMARIRAVLKRTAQPAQDKKAAVYTLRGLTVNPASYEAKIDGEKLPLTPKEFELLLYFIQNPGVVLTRENLLNHIWGFDFYGDSRTVDTHIKMLRNNLGEYRDLIRTVWGVGYRYDETT